MRILVNDIAASKTGALAILMDFYEYVRVHHPEHEWIFLTGIDCIKEAPSNISVYVMDRVKRSQKDRLVFDLINGSSFIEKLNPDIILSLQNTLTKGVIRRKTDLYSADGTLLAHAGDRVPQVLYVHQPLGFQKIKRFSFLKNEEREYAVYQYLIGSLIDASVKRADRVIVQTKWMKDAVTQKTGKAAEKVFCVLPDVGDMEDYRLRSPDDFDRTHFFFPSGEILYKNHELVLKAARILNERGLKNFNVHFTLASLKDVTLREYHDPYGNIDYSGRVSREEVLEEYSKGTLLFPSYIETFGVPLAEARETGTMILASDCPFSREVLEGYENVRFFDPFNETELADLMEKVISGEIAPEILPQPDQKNERYSSYGKIVELVVGVVS